VLTAKVVVDTEVGARLVVTVPLNLKNGILSDNLDLNIDKVPQ